MHTKELTRISQGDVKDEDQWGVKQESKRSQGWIPGRNEREAKLKSRRKQRGAKDSAGSIPFSALGKPLGTPNTAVA